MITGILIFLTVLFALGAILARRLIVSALWLAGTSALLAVVFYQMQAPLIAVIELSVGAGLVTVLFVFAISIAGEDLEPLKSLISQPLAVGVVILSVALLGGLATPLLAQNAPMAEAPITEVIWQERGLDALVQVGLIFAGVLGLLGLLAEAKAPLQYPVAEEVAARRERDLESLSQPLPTPEEESTLEASLEEGFSHAGSNDRTIEARESPGRQQYVREIERTP